MRIDDSIGSRQKYLSFTVFFYFNFEAEKCQKKFFDIKLIFSSQLFFPLLLIPKTSYDFIKCRASQSDLNSLTGQRDLEMLKNRFVETVKVVKNINCFGSQASGRVIAEIICFCAAMSQNQPTATTRRVHARLVLKHGRPSVHIIFMSAGVNLGLHRSIIVSLFKQLDR